MGDCYCFEVEVVIIYPAKRQVCVINDEGSPTEKLIGQARKAFLGCSRVL